MKKKHLIPILLVFIGLAALSFTAAATVKLRIQPKQGKTYTIINKANSMTMMEIQGQTMNMSQNMEIKQTFTPKEVTKKQSVIETQVDAIKMTISQMGMKLEYDSEHPEKTNPMIASQTKEFEESLKKPTTIIYDDLGKIVGDKEELGLNQLGHVIMELPDQDLTVGSKWSQNKEQEVNGTAFTVALEYTVVALSKKGVDLSFTGNIDSKDVTGSYNGTACIDPKTGLIISSTTKTNISMTVNEQGLSIPLTVVGTTTIEVK